MKHMASKLGFGIGYVPWLTQIWRTKFVQSRLRKRRYDENGHLVGGGALVQHARESVQLARSQGLNTGQPSLIKYLLEDEQPQSEREGMNAIFAGTGSTGAAIPVVLHELAMHPEWQSRILSELSSVTYIPYVEFSASQTLRAVIRESLRLTPPFPSTFPREVASPDVVIPGTTTPLPVGTVLGCNHYVICRSKAVFGDDADEWRPERWLDAGVEEAKRMEDVWCVFGRGPRMCVAKDLALMLVGRAVVEVVTKWEVKLVEGGWRAKNDFELYVEELTVSLVERCR